jgi:hypothetical protein
MADARGPSDTIGLTRNAASPIDRTPVAAILAKG